MGAHLKPPAAIASPGDPPLLGRVAWGKLRATVTARQGEGMPDPDQVRRGLEERLRQLGRRLSQIGGDLRKPGNPDFAEAATERENEEVLERLDEAEEKEVLEIRRALERLAAGAYGTCASCGGEIAEGRLEALPYATVCIGCAD